MVCSFQRVEVILPVQSPIVQILSEAGGTREPCIPGPAERAREGERLRSLRTGLERLRRFRTGLYRSLTGWAGRGVRAVRRSLVRAAAVPVLSLEPTPAVPSAAGTRRWPAGRLTPARCATCWPTTAHAPGR